jgi:hypothetical protein|tara:strand:+ start:170 stop:610 length:441 start_codon:yes stop_codon:yes gene_type:complete
MGQKDISYKQLIGYLERRKITPQEAIDIIEKSTPKAQPDNKKFNWKMFRFTLFLWKRVEEDRNGNLWSKTDTAKAVVESKKYKDLYSAFNTSSRFDPKKEAFNLFKLVTDPRQRPYFKPMYFVYEKTKKSIPQDHIDYLMQFPKSP